MNKLNNDLLDETIDVFINNMSLTKPIDDNEGGCYMSYIPHYGYSLIGDGETEKESLENLKELIKAKLGNKE